MSAGIENPEQNNPLDGIDMIVNGIELDDITIIRSYKIHDNGDRPFVVHYCVPKDGTKMEDPKYRNLVVVQYNQVDIINTCDYEEQEVELEDDDILKNDEYYWKGPKHIEAIMPIKPILIAGGLDRVWIDNTHEKNYEYYGEKGIGNTILLEKDNQCIHIGNEGIFKFVVDTKIVKFVSEIGNSDVPYPYAIDENDNYYLLIENTKLSNVPEEHKDDPYGYYYGHTTYNTDTIPADDMKLFKNRVELHHRGR